MRMGGIASLVAGAKSKDLAQNDTPLAALLEHSLVRRVDEPAGAARYVMLETIREFGEELLAATGGEVQAHADHAGYFLAVLRDLLPLATVYGLRAPIERLTAEQGNLRQALTWLQAHGAPGEFVELVSALGLAWYPYHAHREGQHWLEAALARAQSPPLHRARLLIGYGGVCFAQGNQAGIPALLDEAEAHLAALDAPLETTLSTLLRGAMENRDANFAQANVYLNRALERAKLIADPMQRTGMTGRILSNLAVTARGQEQAETALRLMDDALQHYAVAGFDLAEPFLLVTRGMLLHTAGDIPGALASWHRALASMGSLGDPRVVGDSFALAASASVSGGEFDGALLLFGAAEAVREREGTDWSWRNNAPELAALEIARQALGPERAEMLLAAGRAYSQAEATDLIGHLAERTRPRPRPLTRRQLEVLRLLGDRQTDQEIADALFLSRRTVSWHVRAILEHYQAATRDEAITRARSDGVLPGAD